MEQEDKTIEVEVSLTPEQSLTVEAELPPPGLPENMASQYRQENLPQHLEREDERWDKILALLMEIKTQLMMQQPQPQPQQTVTIVQPPAEPTPQLSVDESEAVAEIPPEAPELVVETPPLPPDKKKQRVRQLRLF